jgi:hypothetical protein
MPSKRCFSCGEVKELTEFGRDAPRPDGLRYECKPCNNLRYRTWYANNPQKAKIKNMKKNALAYGLSVERYAEMVERGCDACGSFDQLCIDHDHSCCGFAAQPNRPICGECVRGILCRACNVIEGWAKTPERAIQVAAYMLQFQDVLEGVD